MAVAGVRFEPVGEYEIAKRLGVAKSTVHTWRFRHQMPDPAALISRGANYAPLPLWDWKVIEAWAARRPSLQRRPATASA